MQYTHRCGAICMVQKNGGPLCGCVLMTQPSTSICNMISVNCSVIRVLRTYQIIQNVDSVIDLKMTQMGSGHEMNVLYVSCIMSTECMIVRTHKGCPMRV